ncbi:hypothetical protein ONZ45_g3343 [Pleurotus djamor]|nr:hypothetical protein ONZ45_g3343 [Pleurotus djamor]
MNYGRYQEQQPFYQQPPLLPPNVPALHWNGGQGPSSIPTDHFGILPELPEGFTPSQDWDSLTFPLSDRVTIDHSPTHPSPANGEQTSISETAKSVLLLQAPERRHAHTCPYCKAQCSGTLNEHLKSECTMKHPFMCERCTATFINQRGLQVHQRLLPDYTGLTACDKNIQVVEACFAQGIDVPKLRGRRYPELLPKRAKNPYPDNMSPSSPPPPPPDPKPVISICTRCNLPIPDGESKLHHATKTCPMRPGPPTCKRCHTTFSRMQDLRRHEKMLPDRHGLSACDKIIDKTLCEAGENAGTSKPAKSANRVAADAAWDEYLYNQYVQAKVK